MTKLSLNKETLRRLGTESTRQVVSGMPTADFTDGCETVPGVTEAVTCGTDTTTLTGTITKGTSIRTTGP